LRRQVCLCNTYIPVCANKFYYGTKFYLLENMPTLLIRGRHVGKNMKRGKFEGGGGMREKTKERGKKEKGELNE
jgi:hypothetical protein